MHSNFDLLRHLTNGTVEVEFWEVELIEEDMVIILPVEIQQVKEIEED